MRFMRALRSKPKNDWPDLAEIDEAQRTIRGRVVRTPELLLNTARLRDILPQDAKVYLKLELFQQAGSFKARGVLLSIDGLTPAQKAKGVVAVSGGNHALAVSWAAAESNVQATVVMPKATDPVRIDGCRALGAEIILTDTMHSAFAQMDEIVATGVTPLHPFEGRNMTLGAATCGYEMICDHADLDAVIVPVGGGGLISGVALAVKQFTPECQIIGVEPVGADSITQSLAAGSPQKLDAVNTIADSLGAPYALPYSFGIIKQHVDQMVQLEDHTIQTAMGQMLASLKIMAEPACAASFAALTGPLREQLKGKKVGIIACGSNISPERFAALVKY